MINSIILDFPRGAKWLLKGIIGTLWKVLDPLIRPVFPGWVAGLGRSFTTLGNPSLTARAQRILETAVIPSGADPWSRPAKDENFGGGMVILTVNDRNSYKQLMYSPTRTIRYRESLCVYLKPPTNWIDDNPLT